jgi:hypothetical protein
LQSTESRGETTVAKILAEDWHATLYVQGVAKEQQEVSAGQFVRDFGGNAEFGYYADVSPNGHAWYEYRSIKRPKIKDAE